MKQPDLWRAVRAELRGAGVAEEAVVLPTEEHLGWEGALVVSQPADGRWTIATVDDGRARPLRREATAENIAVALVAYLLPSLPAAQEITAAEREALLSARTSDLSDLVARVRDGGDLLIDVPAGVLLDRVGALDGYRLHPSGTSFEARSLPPTVLRQPLHTVVTAAEVRMRVGDTPPWFGRAGGGLRFEIENRAVGVRDLVREGALRVIVSAENR